jgi:hypothetical protein
MRTLGWLKAGPCAAGRLETKKAGAGSPLTMRDEAVKRPTSLLV